MKNILGALAFIILGGVLLFFVTQNFSNAPLDTASQSEVESSDQASGKQSKNETKALVPMDQIVSGGPPPDGIPPIDNPKFVSVSAATEFVEDSTNGILIKNDDQAKYYPYNIMVWHEIVNDKIGGEPVAVTFCPLCGTGIVFERTIDGKIYDFGTSGKLYNSNLVMYDRQTESYWSQSLGKAIVGPLVGTELVHYPMALTDFKTVIDQHPSAQVLSTETGAKRNYQRNPYQGYDDNEQIFFPVSNRDERLHSKQLMYVLPVGDIHKAYHYNNLSEKGQLTDAVNGHQLTITVADDGEFITKNQDTGERLYGYVEMWFSFIAMHPNAPVWIEDSES